MTQYTMSDKAREAQRQYKKEWRAKNQDKIRAANLRYWEKVASNREAANVCSVHAKESEVNS